MHINQDWPISTPAKYIKEDLSHTNIYSLLIYNENKSKNNQLILFIILHDDSSSIFVILRDKIFVVV